MTFIWKSNIKINLPEYTFRAFNNPSNIDFSWDKIESSSLISDSRYRCDNYHSENNGRYAIKATDISNSNIICFCGGDVFAKTAYNSSFELAGVKQSCSINIGTHQNCFFKIHLENSIFEPKCFFNGSVYFVSTGKWSIDGHNAGCYLPHIFDSSEKYSMSFVLKNRFDSSVEFSIKEVPYNKDTYLDYGGGFYGSQELNLSSHEGIALPNPALGELYFPGCWLDKNGRKPEQQPPEAQNISISVSISNSRQNSAIKVYYPDKIEANYKDLFISYYDNEIHKTCGGLVSGNYTYPAT